MAATASFCEYISAFFGVPSLKAFQLEAINAVLNKEDVFVCAPTGSGKSLCFLGLLPALRFRNENDKLLLVIFSLKSLIETQMQDLETHGIKAHCTRDKDTSKIHFYFGERGHKCKGILVNLVWQNQRLYSFTVIQLPLYKNIQITSNLSLA